MHIHLFIYLFIYLFKLNLFTTASRTALASTQPHIQWEAGALSLVVKRPGREADHSPPSSVVVKGQMELYLHSPNMPSRRGAQLKESTGTTLLFTFTVRCRLFVTYYHIHITNFSMFFFSFYFTLK